ncbi:MAG: 3-hydroxyacyl-ACP dehydratase FabZ [Alphaproteobacteria bacterium]|nr:3-hydroxyacyl-ACP dehydratase FabZ [Alphaproteobacteria bacterium]
MENKVYFIGDILKVLPHRYPFLLIDKIEVIEKGTKGIGYKNVSINEPFFQGHFPNNPVMPGVLQIEAMAQAAGFIVATEDETLTARQVLFMGVDKVKFRKQVLPGDTLEIHASKIRQHKNIVVCEAKSYVGGVLVCQAELTAMIN